MSRVLGVVFLYIAMMAGWIGVGLFMLPAPARFANLVDDSLMLFPEVKWGDWGKKAFVRFIGIGLFAFASRFVPILIRC